MIFNLDKADGERFPFFTSVVDPATGKITYDDPEGTAWVELRPMQPFFEAQFAKRKRITEHVHNPKTRQLERISYFPDLTPEESRSERDDAWDYAITGFGGFKDTSGKVIEFTRENKLKMVKNPVFIRFCDRCFEILANSGVTAETEIKNSSPGRNIKTVKQEAA